MNVNDKSTSDKNYYMWAYAFINYKYSRIISWYDSDTNSYNV